MAFSLEEILEPGGKSLTLPKSLKKMNFIRILKWHSDILNFSRHHKPSLFHEKNNNNKLSHFCHSIFDVLVIWK